MSQATHRIGLTSFGLALLLSISLVILAPGCGDDSSTNPGGGTPTTQVPTVTTDEITGITTTSAECGGTVTSDGGDSVTARGICWGQNATPTLSDSVRTIGADTGSFTVSLNDLETETQYYVRAYATNSVGTGYGTTLSFTTESITGTMTDIDGNVYPTIAIGSQIWMAENLKVTHFRNGEAIPTVLDGIAWDAYGASAYGEFDNSPDSAEVWGRLYNWYAVDDPRGLAPEGWHIPTHQEWQTLQSTLSTDAGNKMKETGDAHWLSPNDQATNESGFTALGAGMRGYQGHYISLYQDAFFWSSIQSGTGRARVASLNHSETTLYLGSTLSMASGLSIRCVKD